MTIALSHGGTNIYPSPALSDDVLIGTIEGVVTIRRASGSSEWRVAHTGLDTCHISSIVIEPESGLVFAGAFHGGIFASGDGGRTWGARDHGLAENDVFSLAARHIGGRVRLFAGTEPAHLFISDDLGLRWEEVPSLRSVPSVPEWTYPGPPHVAHVKHVNFAPNDPRTLYVSVEQGALLKSADDGATWEDLGVPYEDIHRSVIDPRDPDRILVTGGRGLWVSTDGGKTWHHQTTPEHPIGGYPDQLVFRPSNPDWLVIAAGQKPPGMWQREGSSKSRISRSSDGGETWEVLGGDLPDYMERSVEAMCLEEAGDGIALTAATTGGDILRSEDGGDHWSTILTGLAVAKGHHRRFTKLATG